MIFKWGELTHTGRSFIYDSLEAGDVCQSQYQSPSPREVFADNLDPYLTPLHGLLLEPHDADSHPRPHTQLLPLFSLAKTSVNSDILITPLDQFHDPKGRDPVWEDKRDPRLAWVRPPSLPTLRSLTRELTRGVER